MQLWNSQRDQEKLTKKGKFSPHASPTSSHSPRKDVGYLLALAGGINPRQGSPFWGCLQSLWGTTKSQSRVHHLLHEGCVIHSRKHTVVSRFSSVQSLSHVQLFASPWAIAHQVSLSITNSQSLPKLMSIELVMPSNHLTLCRPFLFLPSIFPSIRVFSNESALLIRWPKHWSFSFNISPSNEHPGLISLRIDWLDLLAVQGTLKSLLQHHSSKVSILWRSAVFIVQLSYPYMTTGKNHSLE